MQCGALKAAVKCSSAAADSKFQRDKTLVWFCLIQSRKQVDWLVCEGVDYQFVIIFPSLFFFGSGFRTALMYLNHSEHTLSFFSITLAPLIPLLVLLCDTLVPSRVSAP